MKKILIISVVALFLGFGASLNVLLNKDEVQISDLTLANVEAMATIEIELERPGDNTVSVHSTVGYCYIWINGQMVQGGGQVQCQSGNEMPSCPDCYVM